MDGSIPDRTVLKAYYFAYKSAVLTKTLRPPPVSPTLFAMNILAPIRSLPLRTCLPLSQLSPIALSRQRCSSAQRPVRSMSVMTADPCRDARGSVPDPDRQNVSMVLKDERKLAWREYGCPQGYPVIFMHGNLNSRLFEPSWTASHADAVDASVKVIAVDRPGYG
eukprot:1507474-Rhodomonas_salina.1